MTLVDITGQSGARTAKVEVDGTPYSVSEGESFAGAYRAVSLDAPRGNGESS